MKKMLIASLFSLIILSGCTVEQVNDEVQVSNQFEAQTNSEAMVTVEVTPQQYNQQEWAFEIVLSTHSVNLEYDLTQLTTLTDANGTVYTSPRWEGDPPEGHHRVGELIFKDVENPSQFTLTIRDIDNVEERVFTW